MDEPTLNPGPHYWRSLDELGETPAARAAALDEFPPGLVEAAFEDAPSGLSRRRFLGLVGAAASLAATACSRRDRGSLVPYTRRPEGVVPGQALHYASTFTEEDRVHSVLVKTREGRPIHVSGNPEHPAARGATSTRALADLLGLYDPDRLRHPLLEGRQASWADVESRLGKALAAARQAGKGVLLLTGAETSPTRRLLLESLAKVLPGLRHLAWEPARPEAAAEAARACYGASYRIRPRLDQADVILCLGADPLSGADPQAVAAFAARRRPEPTNRLWVLEGPMTLTGANADHRFPVKPTDLEALALGLAFDLHNHLGIPRPPGVDLPSPSGTHQFPAPAWKALLEDLKRAGKRALVLCGEAMPPGLHRLAHLLNAMLGSVGTTLDLLPAPPLASLAEREAVLRQMAAGDVEAAFIWGVDPLYVAPDPGAWKAALARVPTRVWMGLVEDETASQCNLRLPVHHWLEAWGDHEAEGSLCLQQPTVEPLHDTRQGEDVLLGLARALGAPLPGDYQAFLRARWEQELHPASSPVPFERFFQAALHEGFLGVDRPAPARPAFRPTPFALRVPSQGFELLLTPGLAVHDGRYANNPWLQELPDPVHKTTWTNPLSLSPPDATRLGLADGDRVVLEAGSHRLTLPVVVQPGQAEGVLALALGYGRNAGAAARMAGVNAYPLLATPSGVLTGVSISRAPGRRDLPRTQGHHRLDGRDLVRSWTVLESRREAHHPRHEEHHASLYPDQVFPEHKWGMAIDLAACVGCSACVLACHSENNVGIVGPEQVARGREMHWIRIDRYYEGDPRAPRTVHQPMLCQQCDHAPCENVCPVNATNHSPDGLNQMTYNRCVGTRYCANNCPYKVRRFNFLEATAHKREPETLAYNPEVTVRPRGVMEKCTFCVQRIQEARMAAKAEGRPLRDGDVVPACAAACPAGAIVFGDLKDPESRVSKLAASHRRHKVLEELGVRPAITYLAHLRNPAFDEAPGQESKGGHHEG